MPLRFSAVIDSGDPKAIMAALGDWLGATPILRDKLSGEQIGFEDARVTVECFRGFTARGSSREFLMEGSVSDAVTDAGELLDRLRSAFAGRAIPLELDVNEPGPTP